MGALVKGILQGSIPTIVLVGGTHYLVKGFKVSRPVVYWGSLAVAAGLTYAVVEGKIKAPFMNAETFNAETFEAKVGTPGTRVWVEPEGCYVDTYKHGIVVQEHPRQSKVYQNGKLLKTYRGDGHYISATSYARDLEWNYKPKTAFAETFNAEYEDCQVCFTTVEKGGLNDVQAGLICDTCYDMNKYAGGTGKENNRPYSAETFNAEFLYYYVLNEKGESPADFNTLEEAQTYVANSSEPLEIYERRSRDDEAYKMDKKMNAETFEAREDLICDYCEKIISPNEGSVNWPDSGLTVCDDCFDDAIKNAESSNTKSANKCFICSKPAKNQRLWIYETQPPIADKNSEFWLCNEHNNIYDFGLFATSPLTGEILSWKHPNGTEYVFTD